MSAILIINAISSVLAAAGIGGFLVEKNRRADRDAAAVPVYVEADRPPRRD
jgi:hypothetical protein